MKSEGFGYQKRQGVTQMHCFLSPPHGDFHQNQGHQKKPHQHQASSCLSNGTLLASRVIQGGLRALDKLCVEPAGVSRRCMGVSVPLRFVPSPTGLPSKRCPGIGFISRADREIGVVQHLLQRSCLENPRDGGAWWAAIYGVTQSRT